MVLLLAAASLPASSLFALQRIDVEGLRTLRPEEVRAASGLTTGARSIFLVDAQEVRRRLLRHPRIAAAEVRARPPHSIVIRVEERTPAAAVPVAGGYALVDDGAVVVAVVTDRPGLVLVSERGRPLPWVAPGEGVPSSAVREALSLLREMAGPLRQEVAHLQVDGDREVFLYTADDVEVRAGPVRGVLQRLSAAPEILRMLRARGAPVEYLDLSLPEQAIVKPRGP